MAKKKSAVKQKTAQPFFVGLNNAADVRRVLLEGSKTMLLALKQFEKIKAIRSQKNQLMSKFNSQVSGVKASVNKLQKSLPKYTIPQAQVQKSDSDDLQQVAPVKKQKVTAVTELQKLEEELAAIESKLSSLQ